MELDELTAQMLPAVENELKTAIARAGGAQYEQFTEMMRYHLGWEGPGAGPQARGKRLRPLLLLLSAAAAGGRWVEALPAAAAVELIHNFSLIHDDIEDNSDLRRGRPTVWKRWGVPQAINTGDAMFTLAHLSLLRLETITSAQVVLEASNILQETCLHLTQGQHLDIAYETQRRVALEDYWVMVSGKTAALLAACTEIGALIAGAASSVRAAYRDFGRSLGLAFQAQDDFLGIWGDKALTGKSNASDLCSGKKSLPVLYGLRQEGAFAQRWARGAISPQEVPTLARILAAEGAQDYTQETANCLTEKALQTLLDAHPQGQAGTALQQLTAKLLHRSV